MRYRSPALVAGLSGAGAGALYLLQPIPAFLLGASMTEQPSLHPTWLSIFWMGSAVGFGLGLAVSAYFVRRQPARALISVVASAGLYLVVAAAQVAILSPDPLQGVNNASVMILLSLTYYVNGWIAAVIALAVVGGIVRLERRASSTAGHDAAVPVQVGAHGPSASAEPSI